LYLRTGADDQKGGPSYVGGRSRKHPRWWGGGDVVKKGEPGKKMHAGKRRTRKLTPQGKKKEKERTPLGGETKNSKSRKEHVPEPSKRGRVSWAKCRRNFFQTGKTGRRTEGVETK